MTDSPGRPLMRASVTTPEAWATGLLGLEKLEVTDRTLSLLLTDRDNTRRALAWRKAKLLGDARMLDVVRTHLWNRFNAALRGQSVQETVELPGRDLQALTFTEAVLFGGEGPAADAWATAAGTINYEIVTRVSQRVPRVYVEGSWGPSDG